jgi:hypothetical protein
VRCDGAPADPASQFGCGSRVLFARGTTTGDNAAFAVVDQNHVSGRRLGDAYHVARTFRQEGFTGNTREEGHGSLPSVAPRRTHPTPDKTRAAVVTEMKKRNAMKA